MAAPTSKSIPPLFWIIIAGLVVCVVVAALLYGGSRQGVGADVDTPVNREIGPMPAIQPPDAMPGAPTVPSEREAPPTGGTPLPASDPDAD